MTVSMSGASRPGRGLLCGRLLPLLLLAGAAGEAAHASPAAEPPAPGTYVWIGDRRLHLDCRGRGSPTVMFDAGLGGTSLDWTLVQPLVARFTRACTYDRAGYAWSDPGPLPRNATSIVRDLEQLLGNGSVTAPYVLVGHSFGGLIAQRFARRNPRRTAGLVLVDATHEDLFRRLEEAVTPSPGARQWSRLAVRDSYDVPEGLPEEISRMAGTFVARPQSIVAVRSELTFLRGGMDTPLAGELPDVPLVVISHRVLPPAASRVDQRLEGMWMDLQRDLASLTPRSSHVIARTADHYVHIREPELVVDAVRSVVEQHRRGAKARARLARH